MEKGELLLYFSPKSGNWTAVSNVFIDLASGSHLTRTQIQVLLILVRFTAGWTGYKGNDRNVNSSFAEVNLSLSMITKHAKISRKAAVDALNALQELNVVIVTELGHGRRANRYALNYDASTWAVGTLDPVVPTSDLYDGCQRSGNLEVTTPASSSNLEVTSSSNLEVTTSSNLEVTSRQPQSPANTEAAPAERNQKKSKENTLRVLDAEGVNFSFLKNLDEIRQREKLTADEVVWQVDEFMRRFWGRGIKTEEQHDELLGNLLKGYTPSQVLLGVHYAYPKVVNTNRALRDAGKSHYGDPVKQTLIRAADDLAEVRLHEENERRQREQRAQDYTEQMQFELSRLYGDLSVETQTRFSKAGAFLAGANVATVTGFFRCFKEAIEEAEQGRLDTPDLCLDRVSQLYNDACNAGRPRKTG